MLFEWLWIIVLVIVSIWPAFRLCRWLWRRLVESKTHNNQGMAHAFNGDYERAIRAFDQALQLAPNFALAYNNRGSTYAEIGKYDRAIQDFDQALQLDRNLALAYVNRGAAYVCEGQHDRARSDFHKALALGYDRATVEAMLTELP